MQQRVLACRVLKSRGGLRQLGPAVAALTAGLEAATVLQQRLSTREGAARADVATQVCAALRSELVVPPAPDTAWAWRPVELPPGDPLEDLLLALCRYGVAGQWSS